MIYKGFHHFKHNTFHFYVFVKYLLVYHLLHVRHVCILFYQSYYDGFMKTMKDIKLFITQRTFTCSNYLLGVFIVSFEHNTLFSSVSIADTE